MVLSYDISQVADDCLKIPSKLMLNKLQLKIDLGVKFDIIKAIGQTPINKKLVRIYKEVQSFPH